MTEITQDMRIRIQEAYQAYVKAPAKSAAQEAAFDNLLQITFETGAFEAITEGYKDLSKLPAEIATHLPENILRISQAAADNNIAAIQSLILKDQDIVGNIISGGVGWISFAKSMVTLVRMFVDDDSEIGQWVKEFDERLDELGGELRQDQRDADTVPTITEATQIVAGGVESAMGQVGNSIDTMDSIANQIATGIGLSSAPAAANGATPVSAGIDVGENGRLAQIVAETISNAQQRVAFMTAAEQAALTDDHDSHLSANEANILFSSSAVRNALGDDLDDTRRAVVREFTPS